METNSTNGTNRTGTPDLGPVATAVARLAEGVTDASLGEPTPCPKYAVRELLAHVVGLSAAFRDAARKDFGPSTAVDPGTVEWVLGGDWRSELPRLLDELVNAWRDPGAWDGDTRAGGIVFPAAVAGRVALNELLVHGWDLARATGRDYAPDEAALRVSYGLLAPAADDGGRGGMFGPVVQVPDDATLLDRVIGLSGRRPDWRPGD
ncbi:TIGR03086 family metal-binding protein [Streptomyces sp. HNM0645]|uniref:TIGR03086 family metal-binding protein n=1 Tax=Streptomyces sp. HNM0645 TaxID=2782343 RepID=UPI0024B78618|nr:TIGR03086 family metal-binding protein [Streptomyces sp. HNM0645]MDI9882841.1 TIGR03086 family metal-binding protein [Streptomyces sp. HNM0645]